MLRATDWEVSEWSEDATQERDEVDDVAARLTVKLSL